MQQKAPEPEDVSKLEVAHILFTDMVGFSKLPMEEQKKAIQYLGKLVRETQSFREADPNSLIRITTGDGFALVFFDDPEAPIKCARELGRQLRADPRVKLRMGLHSGAVYRISNINEKTDVTGSGINMAQRVMDCGDAGHILASAAVANLLGGLDAWSGDLHDLGRVEIKGGERVRIFNMYGDDYGNPEAPAKLQAALHPPDPIQPQPDRAARKLPFRVSRKTMVASTVAIALMTVGVLAVLLFSGSQYNSLAVVPFDYESDEAAYLANDLPERLSLTLSDLPKKLSVRRSNQRIYKWQPLSNIQEVGRSLGVQALLKGSLKKAGDSILLDVHLIDVGKGKELWTKQYSQRLAEVGTVEQDIAQMVTENLSIKLTDEEKELLRSGPSKYMEANQLYEEGLGLLAVRDEASLQTATNKFQQAVQRDPKFARAFAKLADSLVLRNVYGKMPSGERMKEAEAAANEALRLNGRLADAHISLAYINFRYNWVWVNAENEFKGAIELDDLDAQAHDWYADYLEAMGRANEAVKQMERAVDLDRQAVWINADLGLAYCYAGRFDDAINQLTKTLSLANGTEDKRFVQTRNYLGLTYERKGVFDQAAAEYEKALNLDKNNPRLKAILAHGYAISGQTEKGQQLASELARNEQVPFYYEALAYAVLPKPEDKDRAFKLLSDAIEKREPNVVFLGIDPRFSESIRKDPRFKKLLDTLNLLPK